MERSTSEDKNSYKSEMPQGNGSNDDFLNRQKSVTYVKASSGLFDFLANPAPQQIDDDQPLIANERINNEQKKSIR